MKIIGRDYLSRDEVKIKDIDRDILEGLKGLWVPEEKSNDPFYIEGDLLWKKWIRKNMEEFRSIGKVAIQDSKIVGMIQYIPKTEQKVVEIKSLIVDREDRDMLIRSLLLKETVREFERPKRYFDHQKAKALVTLNTPFPLHTENADFYRESGFEPLSDEYEQMLYYPLTEEHLEYDPAANMPDFPLEDVDRDKALILCNPHNPYCVEEMMNTLEQLRKIDTEIPVKLVVPFEEPDEFSRVFSMPLSVLINGQSIGFSTLDEEQFLECMKDTLDSETILIEDNIESNSPQI